MNLMRKTRKLFIFVLSLLLVVTMIPNFSSIFAEDIGATDLDQQTTVEQQADADAEQDVQAGQDAATDQSTDMEQPSAETEGEEAVDEAIADSTKDADAEKVESEKKQGSEESKSEEIATTQFTEEIDGVVVDVYTEEGAFDEDVSLKVKPIAEGSKAYKQAEEALAENEQVYAGMLAFDIHFENSDGKEVEPNGVVSVKMTAKQEALEDVDLDAFDADSVQVTHIGKKATEVVADTEQGSEIDGTVDIEATEKSVAKIDAEFDVEEFSTFTLTWGSGQSATIHFGTSGADGFTEFADEQITFDTTASTISIANTFEGYHYLDAVYCTNGQSIEEGIDIESVLQKNEDGSWSATKPKSESGSAESVDIENGSHIYVSYYQQGTPSPSGSGDDTVPSPTTEKSVTDNGDGTYTITLDVTGAKVTEDNSHYVNVLIVLDATRSMNGTKWTNAKAAMNTLIETLSEGENAANAGKIDYALVTFGRSATVHETSGAVWTKDNAAFKSTCAGVNMVTTYGTNWEAGMRGALYGALSALPSTDTDPTYVIFLTDGDPNVYYQSGAATNYTNDGTTNGYSQNNNTSANHSADEASTIAASTKLYGIYCGDSGTTPSGESYNRLVNVIEGQGQGGQDTIAANADTIESEFQAIAETALKDIGASEVAVDDGLPQLASVSSQVVEGDVGGYEYYKKDADETEFSVWSEAPGASYSEENGVTWDLSEVGTLEAETTYRIKFTVWPSQEAYDLIADLNNGLIDYDDLTDEQKAQIGGNKTDGYYMYTNTHLNTTYTVGDTEYSDSPEEVPQAAMPLPTETISVEKIWNNLLDQQNPPDDGIKLILEKDGEPYLSGKDAIEVSKETSWKQDGIYISVGQIKSTEDGYDILETGHDYAVVEPEDYEGNYRWELTSEVYHPMVIDGVTTMLIQDDAATGTDGEDYYTINGKKYKTAPAEGNMLKAWNDRRSWLQIEKKAIEGEGAPEDALFEFTITINDANEEDVWYSVYGPDGLVKDLETDGNAEEGNTGYYYQTSGTPIKVKIQKGWTLRFINLPSGTTYTVEETGFPDGFAFDTAEDRQVVDTEAEQDDPERPQIAGKTVSGTINVPNVEFYVDYTNKYAKTTKEITKTWVLGEGATEPDISPEEFKELVKLTAGETDVTDKYASTLTVTQDSSNKMKYTVKYENLPKYVNGEEVTYTITEDAIEGYTAETDSNGNITNTRDKGNLKIEKTISPEDVPVDADQLTFTVTGPDGFNKTVTYSDFTNGSYTFNNVAIGEYTVEESGAAVSGYTLTATYSPDGGKATVVKGETAEVSVTNTYDSTEYTATKVWDDADDQDGKRPKTIQLQLKQNDADYGDPVTVGLDDDGEPLEGTEVSEDGNSWSYTWSPLETKVDGEDATYSADEVAVPTGYTKTVEEDTITNTYVPAETTVTVTKAWDDADDQDGIRPDSIEVQLKADGTDKGDVVELNEENEWTYTWESLPVNADGEAIEYTVDEPTVPEGYTKTVGEVTGDAEEGFKVAITNEHVPAETTVTVTKVWDDADDQDGIRPDSVKVQLMANGEESGDPVTLNADNEWTYTWEGIAVNAGGNAIEYTVKEIEVPEGYEVKVTGDAEEGFTVTNTHEPEPDTDFIDPPVQKVIKGNTPKETETYTFKLEAKEDANPMPEAADGQKSMTTTIKGEGKNEFGKIVFTADDVRDEPYYYRITEVPGTNENCDYDDTVYFVKVTVTLDDEGNVKADSKYTKKGGGAVTAGIFKFVNTYTDEPVPPITGDDSNMLPAWIILILSAFALAGFYIRRRRED